MAAGGVGTFPTQIKKACEWMTYSLLAFCQSPCAFFLSLSCVCIIRRVCGSVALWGRMKFAVVCSSQPCTLRFPRARGDARDPPRRLWLSAESLDRTTPTLRLRLRLSRSWNRTERMPSTSARSSQYRVYVWNSRDEEEFKNDSE